MNSLYNVCENAIFEALVLYPEYEQEGVENVDVCEVGGGFLSFGQFGNFVYLYGRGLALRVRQQLDFLADKEWLDALQDTIVRGYSLHDCQGVEGGICYKASEV